MVDVRFELEIRTRDQRPMVLPSTPYVRRQGGDTEYPLAGLPILLVHGGYSLLISEDGVEKQLYYSQSRDGI